MSATLTFQMKPASAADKAGSGGAAGVEIAGFPQILYTRAFGDPDMLFHPLLQAAREAYQMTQRLSGLGEQRASAVSLSGMQLASALLRDSGFSLGAKGLPHENLYVVDLDAGTMLVHTRLYAVVSRRTSFFKVEIAGKISDGIFVVRNSGQSTAVGQFDEQESKAPGFFATKLAQECLRAQMEQERFGRIEETTSLEADSEVRLMIAAKFGKIPVILRQKKTGETWDIVDGRRQESVGSLSPEAQGSLAQVVRFLQDLFAQK